MFPPATSSVTEARHWARRVGREWGVPDDVLERVALCVTELSTNAVVHAHSPFRVSLSLDGEFEGLADDSRVRVEVADSSAGVPRLMHVPPDATAGRGMEIVNALSVRTGVRRLRSGKRVWAVVES